MSPGTDSAGQPFDGRAFEPNPHAGDTGECDPGLARALTGFFAGTVPGGDSDVPPSGIEEVVSALRLARVLIPLLAEAGDTSLTAEGLVVEKSQELSVLHLEAPDGRAVSPIFSDVTALSSWNQKARPIPVLASKAALAAGGDGLALLVLNPGTSSEITLRRGAIKALATGEPYLPAYSDPAVVEALTAAFQGESAWATIESVRSGDPHCSLAGPEVIVTIRALPGLSSEELHSRLVEATRVWGEDPVLAERVDGFGVKVLPA